MVPRRRGAETGPHQFFRTNRQLSRGKIPCACGPSEKVNIACPRAFGERRGQFAGFADPVLQQRSASPFTEHSSGVVKLILVTNRPGRANFSARSSANSLKILPRK